MVCNGLFLNFLPPEGFCLHCLLVLKFLLLYSNELLLLLLFCILLDNAIDRGNCLVKFFLGLRVKVGGQSCFEEAFGHTVMCNSGQGLH